MSILDRFRAGPEQQAAQQRLDQAATSGEQLSVEEAEALSDAVWAARERDIAARGSGDEEREL